MRDARAQENVLKGAATGGGLVGEATRWSVVVVDALTVKILSSACQMSHMLDYGVSLVESISKSREPQPTLQAIYFVQPTADNVRRLIEDFRSKRPMYRAAHVFFTSKLSAELLATIKSQPALVARLESLKEVNVEVMATEARSFSTGNPLALQALFGDNAHTSQQYEPLISTVSSRLATVFSLLKEFPSIRYMAPKPAASSQTAADRARSGLAQRIAGEVYSYVSALQRSRAIPSEETCDLLVVDRSIDTVAPVIHEWTYEAMCYDLLPITDNQFSYTTKSTAGKDQKKVVMLGDHDPLWSELRHLHIADVMLRLGDKTKEFASKNEAAKRGKGGAAGGGDGGGMSTGQMRRLVESLPQYREQLAKLDMHSEMARELNDVVHERVLNEVGRLEQEVVFNDAKGKDLIKLFGERAGLATQDKLRLLLCYLATHPSKLDAAERIKWSKVANLSAADISALNNLEHLGVDLAKKSTTAKAKEALSWSSKTAKATAPKHRALESSEWSLSRFQPLVHMLLEELIAGSLSSEEYPYVRTPAESGARGAVKPRGQSLRTKYPALWSKVDAAKAAKGEEDAGPRLRKVVLFVIGGITRSELRAVYEISKATGRDVIIGSTSLDTPHEFITQLSALSQADAMEL